MRPYIGTNIINALFAIFVGVVVGFGVNYLTERLPGLEYQMAAPGVFWGQSERIGVLALHISNPAKKEVEKVTAELNLQHLELKEAKIVGLQSGAYSQLLKNGIFSVEVPSLNPKETFSIQLLVTSKEPQIEIPT